MTDHPFVFVDVETTHTVIPVKTRSSLIRNLALYSWIPHQVRDDTVILDETLPRGFTMHITHTTSSLFRVTLRGARVRMTAMEYYD